MFIVLIFAQIKPHIKPVKLALAKHQHKINLNHLRFKFIRSYHYCLVFKI